MKLLTTTIIKVLKIWGTIVILFMISETFFACGEGDEGKNSTVKIDEKGDTNDDTRFVAIDDSHFYINDVKYTVVQGHLEVTGYDESAKLGELSLFSDVIYKSNHYKVLRIADNAFRSCSSLYSVIIPNSVTTIGESAFSYCVNLVSVNIPNSVTEIEDEAFRGCTALNSIVIPNSIVYIGSLVFEGCSRLTSVTIPDGVIEIGSEAFSGCKGLSSITIPNSVTNIGNSAFKGCTGFTSITIPDGVKTINAGAFFGCTSLTSVTIPNSVTTIGNQAFANCTSFETIVVIPTVPPYLSYNSFNNTNNCPIYVPSQSVDLYKTADGWNKYKTRIKTEGNENSDARIVEIDNNNFYINYVKYTIIDEHLEVTGYKRSENPREDVEIVSDVIFKSKQYKVLRIGRDAFAGSTLNSVTIPNSVTEIDDFAFYQCEKLNSLTIGNAVNRIGKYAFCGCINITTLILPNSVREICEGAFQVCTKLSSVTIPNGVEIIGNSAFRNCIGLTSVTIPNSVTSLGVAFSGCSGLLSLIVKSGNLIYDSRDDCNAIIKTKNNELITGCKNTIIPNSVTSIGESAFYDCTDLTSITIPNSVTTIEQNAFSGCTGLTSITIPNSVKRIDHGVFRCCKALTSVTIPNGVTDICNGAFDSCNKLTSVTIPESVTGIGIGAFSYCSGLTYIDVLPKTPPKIINYLESIVHIDIIDPFLYTNNCPIYVPSQSVDLYKTTDIWKENKDRIRAK